MKKICYTALLVILLTVCSCSCSFLSNQTKETTSNLTTCITEKIYVEVENIDNKNKGIIYAHEKDVFYHKLNLKFTKKNIDKIDVGDVLEISYCKIVEEAPATYVVVEYRKLD